MKNNFFILNLNIFLFGIIYFLPWSVSHSEEKRKIVYVDIEYVFQNSLLKEKLNRKYKQQKERFMKLRQNAEEKLGDFRKYLRQLEEYLGHSEYVLEFKNLQEDKKNLEAEVIEARKDFKKWEKENQAIILDEFYHALEILAKEEKIDIILSKKKTIIFGDNKFDVSERIISILEDIKERDSVTAK